MDNKLKVTEVNTSLTAFSCMLDAAASTSSVALNSRLVHAVVKFRIDFRGCGHLLCRHDDMS